MHLELTMACIIRYLDCGRNFTITVIASDEKQTAIESTTDVKVVCQIKGFSLTTDITPDVEGKLHVEVNAAVTFTLTIEKG